MVRVYRSNAKGCLALRGAFPLNYIRFRASIAFARANP